MNYNSPIVEETRQVRYLISLKFDHDINRFIEYLQNEEIKRKKKNVSNNHSQSETSTSETYQPKTEN